MAAERIDEIAARLDKEAEKRQPPPWTEESVPLELYEAEQRVNGRPLEAGPPISTTDFYAYMPLHQYIFVPSRELWPPASVNARIAPIDVGAKKPMRASDWLDQNRPVDQMIWAPGLPLVIPDKLISGGGWIDRAGSACFNLYIPPRAAPGDASGATRWVEHVHRVFPEHAAHIIRWLAHRVQRPGEKINHALVLGGAQGVGKDTIIEPVKHSVGPWNVAEVSPSHLLAPFNGFVRCVILRVNEARDLGDVDRYGFYDHMKVYTAAPPDVIRCNEKNLREYSVANVCGVIITTNHKTDGIYLPADDRRHYVAWSPLAKEDFSESYWRDLYGWYGKGGIQDVTAYLEALDLAAFDPKAPPPKTAAFWDIVDANRAPEDADLADVLESLGNRPVVTLVDLATYATEGFRGWLEDRKNRRQVPHRLEAAGYTPVRNDAAADGLWRIHGRRQAVYARKELPVRDRLGAASKLAREASQ